MALAPTVLDWNGEDIPTELRALPMGRYLIVPIDDAPELSVEDAAGLERALASIAAGRGVGEDAARRTVRERLGR